MADTAGTPFTRTRLVSFLVLHFLALASEIGLIGVFITTGDQYFYLFLILPLVVSGAFCTHAAWHCDAPNLGWCRCLPLKDMGCFVTMILAVPLGFLQGIIVILALEDFKARQKAAPPPGEAARSSTARSSKFHCKAVIALMEGCPSSAVTLYAFWTLGYPPDGPITESLFSNEPLYLAAAGSILFMSSGLGLMELDCCTSLSIFKRMRRSTLYEAVHWVYRTSEVASRVIVHVFFMVATRKHWCGWWVPLAMDFVTTTGLVTIYGGSENTWFLKLMCSISCSFANIFAFIDSPYKQKAARRLTYWLTAKHMAEMVFLPVIAKLVVTDIEREVRMNWTYHEIMINIGIVSSILYWTLHLCISCCFMRDKTIDIYSACERGSLRELRLGMRNLTQGAAIRINVNHEDINGNTLLMLAACRGHAQVCQYLLQEGARVDVPVRLRNRVLRRAFLSLWRFCPCHGLVQGHIEGWTALHMAAWRNRDAVIQILIQGLSMSHTVDIGDGTFQDCLGETPLHVASRAGSAEAARALMLAYPGWTERTNCRGERPIDVASSEEVRQAIRYSFSNMTANTCQTPLLNPGTPAGQGSLWPQVSVQITKTEEESQLVAPGLCSYISGTCGGALGRIFLTKDPLTYDCLVFDTHCSCISEASSIVSTDMSMQNSFVQASRPEIEDLVPVDEEGGPINWAADGLGRYFQVPEGAIVGIGSYGIVWRAKSAKPGSTDVYAVKNIAGDVGLQSVAIRECDVADRVLLTPHPCLVQMLNVFRHTSTSARLYMLVMEYCPGGELTARIRAARWDTAAQEGRAYEAPPRALHWVGEIFLGLEHMHLRMGILLQDMKPDNVVLTTAGHAKLTDFGFGRFGQQFSPGNFEFGVPAGSPGYISPEILRKEAYDSKADLYSLGVLVWTLQTGGLRSKPDPQPPFGKMRFEGDFKAYWNDHAMLYDCITNPDQHDAQHLPGDARDFVLRLTHRYPDYRLSHASIRKHAFFKDLCLPAFEEPPDAVAAWLLGGAAGGGDSAV